MHLTTHFR